MSVRSEVDLVSFYGSDTVTELSPLHLMGDCSSWGSLHLSCVTVSHTLFCFFFHPILVWRRLFCQQVFNTRLTNEAAFQTLPHFTSCPTVVDRHDFWYVAFDKKKQQKSRYIQSNIKKIRALIKRVKRPLQITDFLLDNEVRKWFGVSRWHSYSHTSIINQHYSVSVAFRHF